MPDSGKRKVNTAIYGTDRFDHEPSPVCSLPPAAAPPRWAHVAATCAQEDKAEQLVSALREHVGECHPRPCCRCPGQLGPKRPCGRWPAPLP